MYCGILPYTVVDGEIYLILGYETRGISEFGGTAESDNLMGEAVREFHEETHGLFIDLTSDMTLYKIYSDPKAIVYAYHLPDNVDYTCRVQCYNNMTYFLRTHNVETILGPSSGLFEKHYLKMYSIHDVPLKLCSYHFRKNFPVLQSAIQRFVTTNY